MAQTSRSISNRQQLSLIWTPHNWSFRLAVAGLWQALGRQARPDQRDLKDRLGQQVRRVPQGRQALPVHKGRLG